MKLPKRLEQSMAWSFSADGQSAHLYALWCFVALPDPATASLSRIDGYPGAFSASFKCVVQGSALAQLDEVPTAIIESLFSKGPARSDSA